MSANIELNWEWPASRTTEDKFLVSVVSIKPKQTGLFGFLKSPSLVNGFPDPQILIGKVIASGSGLSGMSVNLILPLLELDKIKVGDTVMLGVVEQNICICIVVAEDEHADINMISCP